MVDNSQHSNYVEDSKQQKLTKKISNETIIKKVDKNENESKLGKVKKEEVNARVLIQAWCNRAFQKKVSGLREEFASLRRYVPKNITIKAFLSNPGLCRYKDVPTNDANRVILYNKGVEQFIHANYTSTPFSNKRFICTQGPMDCTISHFWLMIWQEEVENIIMLCNIIEKGQKKCSQYYPITPGTSENYNEFTVKLVDSKILSKDADTVKKNIILISKKGETGTRTVYHYHWQDWPDRGAPPINATPFFILSAVRGTKKPIVVHCSAGIGRTGTIVAIEYVLERFSCGQSCEAMDQILKDMRDQRAYSIQNEHQYLYIHRVLMYYIFERGAKITNEDVLKNYKTFCEDYNSMINNI
uniref:Uncharacterized protein n=1 Tax=Strongyloides stercoralis TaxID=6248 RepID=A0A0K0DVI8_STRER